jgi:hypothetical protein
MDEPFDRQTLLLSAAQPGLGQLASGRGERGLILLALSLVFGILGGVDGTLLKLVTGGRRPIRALPDRLNPLALIWAGIYAYNLYDAYNIASGLDEEDADLLDYEEYTPGDTAESYVTSGGTRSVGTEGALKIADAPAPSSSTRDLGTEGALKIADAPAPSSTRDLGTEGALKIADAPAPSSSTRDLGTEGALKIADAPAPAGTSDVGTEGALKIADAPAPERALKVADQAVGENATPIPEGALKIADAAGGSAPDGALKVADSWSDTDPSSTPAEVDAEVASIRALGDGNDDSQPASPEVAAEVEALHSLGGNADDTSADKPGM